jgi:hypothetical protein
MPTIDTTEHIANIINNQELILAQITNNIATHSDKANKNNSEIYDSLTIYNFDKSQFASFNASNNKINLCTNSSSDLNDYITIKNEKLDEDTIISFKSQIYKSILFKFNGQDFIKNDNDQNITISNNKNIYVKSSIVSINGVADFDSSSINLTKPILTKNILIDGVINFNSKINSININDSSYMRVGSSDTFISIVSNTYYAPMDSFALNSSISIYTGSKTDPSITIFNDKTTKFFGNVEINKNLTISNINRDLVSAVYFKPELGSTKDWKIEWNDTTFSIKNEDRLSGKESTNFISIEREIDKIELSKIRFGYNNEIEFDFSIDNPVIRILDNKVLTTRDYTWSLLSTLNEMNSTKTVNINVTDTIELRRLVFGIIRSLQYHGLIGEK